MTDFLLSAIGVLLALLTIVLGWFGSRISAQLNDIKQTLGHGAKAGQYSHVMVLENGAVLVDYRDIAKSIEKSADYKDYLWRS